MQVHQRRPLPPRTEGNVILRWTFYAMTVVLTTIDVLLAT